MTPQRLQTLVIRPALGLLPEPMHTPRAEAMLLCIALQESRCTHRRQINGPARGLYQFELGGGVTGVLTHHASREHIRDALAALAYPPDQWDPAHCYEAIEHNDLLATVFARLLLWTHPAPLCGPEDSEGAWTQYLATWRPGRPHRATWGDFYAEAWRIVGQP